MRVDPNRIINLQLFYFSIRRIDVPLLHHFGQLHEDLLDLVAALGAAFEISEVIAPCLLVSLFIADLSFLAEVFLVADDEDLRVGTGRLGEVVDPVL